MRYQNRKNGVIIEVKSVIAGADWVALDGIRPQTVAPKKIPAEVSVKPAEVKQPKQVEEQSTKGSSTSDDIDSITVKEIKQELDANGINYSKTAKKQELYDLMMGM